MMLYLAPKKITDISFDAHQCAWFTHNTKESHETAAKRICCYHQGTNENVLVSNPSKKLVVGCYADAVFEGLWGNEDPQDLICDRSRNRFVVTFTNCPLLWVSKLQT